MTAGRTMYAHPVDAELAKWPGVTAKREGRGKHYALVLTYDGRSMFVIYPCSPSDALRGVQNHLADVSAVLCDLSAERVSRARSIDKPKRVRNRTTPRRMIITDRASGGPRRDPWALLRGLFGGMST